MDAYHQRQRASSTPTRSDLASGLGQLRQNLRDARLRESLHRPYYPSPLSRSPVQASISSASRTAASVASSSRSTVSTSTTPPSSTSRFSINQAFKDLNDDDISFFDRLISTLPAHAADFAQLKSAYTAHLPDELEHRHRQASSSQHADHTDWDAHLWSILLSLVKVRGRTWRERWDSVRLAFGLDPNSGDETDQSAATQSTSVSATGSSTQHAYDSESEHEWEKRHQQRIRDRRHGSHQAQSHRYDLGLPRASSPPPSRRGEAVAQIPNPSLKDELAEESQLHTGRMRSEDPISAIQARLSRMLESEDDLEQSDASISVDREEVAPNGVPRLPSDARRRFDQLVQSSLLARTKLRQSQAQTHELEAQGGKDESLEEADWWRARRLLQTSLAWWITLTRKHLERSQNAVDASQHVLVQKAWERWRAESLRDLESGNVGEKTDRVRCTLTALRHWKRRAHTAVERKEELKKGSMRTACYTTTASVKKRVLTQAFGVWRNRHRSNLADDLRQHHLQSGAFALWQMRSTQRRQLSTREKIVQIQQNHSILSRAWDRWADKSDQAQDVRQIQHHHNRRLALEALHIWRERATLSSLAEAFAQRRLKLAALDSWKVALDQKRLHRKQEALANRWRARRLKSSAFAAWRDRNHDLFAMQQQAIETQKEARSEQLRNALHRWQLRSRAALLDRVRTTGSMERTFHQWKHRYTALTTSLKQRESTLINRRQDQVKVACFGRWRQLAKQIHDREAEAQARRNEIICNDFFITWRNKQLEHRLLQQKSEAVSHFFILRSTLRQWRVRLREHRADAKEAAHDGRLVHQVFEIWRSKAAKQQRLATLLQVTLAEKDEALARAYLKQWVGKIIEVRNRELEVKEQRERRLVKAAFYAWIEACLRHDDLLALMNSYIDVKEEDRKRKTFLRWLDSAREHKDRREKAEMIAVSTQKKLLAATWSTWQDKIRERSLATQEYDMLIRRQQLAKQWALNAWQSQTLLLPAIRMRNTSLKRRALQQWREHLPEAQKLNQADKILRTKLLQHSWQTWKDSSKAKRQLRAAARFGAGSISTQRLRKLSAAASAANRSTGSSSPSTAQSSSPFRAPGIFTPVRRPRTSMALRVPTPVDDDADVAAEGVRPSRPKNREASFSRRSTSVPRHLETSFSATSADATPLRRSAASRERDADSPSKEALSRKTRTAAASAVPSSTSFSRALQSSSSTISATTTTRQPYATRDGPTLSSAAQRSAITGQASDTDSDYVRRVRRSAKYEQATPTVGSRTVGLRPPASNDGFESGDSVRSAPVQAARHRESLAVAEDMISQLRAKARSQQRHVK